MLQKASLPGGLDMRPSRPSDKPFLSKLFRATRPFLNLIDGERDFIESIFEMQERAQTQGYGEQTPDALEFVIEKTGDLIGRLVLDFSGGTVHVVDIAFLPEVQGKGYGKIVLGAVQETARVAGAPVTLTYYKGTPALGHFYARMGFVGEAETATHVRMIWTPPGAAHLANRAP